GGRVAAVSKDGPHRWCSCPSFETLASLAPQDEVVRGPVFIRSVTRASRPDIMIPNAMPPFDFGLGETADALRDQVQRFSAEEVAPIAAELDKTDRFPRELWPKMGELGLHGITVEEEYGGSGLGYLEHVIAVEELSRASAAVGLSYGAHSNLCVNQISRHGSDDQK